MRLILIIATVLVLGLCLSAFAQTGQIQPPGPTPPPVPICVQTICTPPDQFGRAGTCSTTTVACPVTPAPTPACVNSWGQIVPCK